ncbi:MAG: hypothetical protein ACLQBL_39570 [Polyangiaceae bacterium]
MGFEPFDEHLVVREHNRWLLGLSLGPGLVALGLLVLSALRLASSATVPPLVIVSALASLLVVRRNPAPSLHEESVRLEPDVLRVGKRAIPRSSIRDAQLVPLGNHQLVVRIWRPRRLPTDFIVRDKAEGQRMLRALGFDVSQTVTKFRSSSLVLRHWAFRSGLLFVVVPILFALVGGFLRTSPELFALLAKGLTVLGASTLLAMAMPSRIAVGADGILVTWLGLKQFHPMSKIRDAARYIDGFGNNQVVGVSITMEGGHVVRLPTGSARWDDDRASALVERIREAMDAHARGRVETAAALLGRRERGVREWIQELRAIGAGANADLRTAPVNPENLWRIVESHGAEPEARAAAAVALGPQLDDEGRQRLRVAVDAVADERLRVAIDAAASADDAALEEALGDVSDGGAAGEDARGR